MFHISEVSQTYLFHTTSRWSQPGTHTGSCWCRQHSALHSYSQGWSHIRQYLEEQAQYTTSIMNTVRTLFMLFYQ